MNIYDIRGLKRNLRPCQEIIIYRPQLDYYHHVFVGDANELECNLYHYSYNKESFWFSPPAQIKKERLIYALYNVDESVKKIFDFKNGDKVIIVNRNDYPKLENEAICIERAESRLGEKRYSIAFNNCESYVNWIFSGDNTSKQYINASSLTKARIHYYDECISKGVLRIIIYLLMLYCMCFDILLKLFQDY